MRDHESNVLYDNNCRTGWPYNSFSRARERCMFLPRQVVRHAYRVAGKAMPPYGIFYRWLQNDTLKWYGLSKIRLIMSGVWPDTNVYSLVNWDEVGWIAVRALAVYHCWHTVHVIWDCFLCPTKDERIYGIKSHLFSKYRHIYFDILRVFTVNGGNWEVPIIYESNMLVT